MNELEVMGIDWNSLLVPKIPILDIVLRTVLIFMVLQIGLRSLGRKNMVPSASYNTVTLFLVGAFGGRAVLGEDTSMTACVLGLSIVLILNSALSYATYRSKRLAVFFEGPPVQQLVKNGILQERKMRETHCSKEILLAHLRSRGESDLENVADAFMERTGQINFIMK